MDALLEGYNRERPTEPSALPWVIKNYDDYGGNKDIILLVDIFIYNLFVSYIYYIEQNRVCTFFKISKV